MTLRVITVGWSTSKVSCLGKTADYIEQDCFRADRLVMVTIEFPKGWTNAPKLEKILLASPGPHLCSEVFRFCKNSKLMIDAIVRLLSLLNQLEHCSRRVILAFDDGMDGVMGYLNRIGFFDESFIGKLI